MESVKVLVVEDNPVHQSIAQHVIESMGLQCEIAKDGETAIKLFRENKYTLVLMDIGLPDKDGYRVGFSMRAYEADVFNATPIVCFSSHSGNDYHDRCLAVGMNAAYSKPLTKDLFMEIIKSHCMGEPVVRDTQSSSSGFFQPEYEVIPVR